MQVTKLLPALALVLFSLRLSSSSPLRSSALRTQLAPERYSFTPGDHVKAALKKAGVIPDVLDDFQPDLSISFSYPSTHQTVDLGNDISPTDATSAPVFVIQNLSTLEPTRTIASNITYTLVLTDPDATSHANPVMSEMCHWIATNIKIVQSNSDSGPASSREFHAYEMLLNQALSKNITELLPYIPPSPPPKTGRHRYIFVLLASSEESESPDLRKPKERPHWGYGKVGRGIRDWAKDNGLVAVGANFFYAQNKKQ